jgi:hypothetical protein
VVFSLLFGCAHQPREKSYGEFYRKLNPDMLFLTEYIVVYKVKNKFYREPFLNDSYLSDNMVTLECRLRVLNPSKMNYIVWSIKDVSTEEKVGTSTEPINSSNSVDKTYVIPLPLDIEPASTMRFHIDVYSHLNGEILYQSEKLIYKKK